MPATRSCSTLTAALLTAAVVLPGAAAARPVHPVHPARAVQRVLTSPAPTRPAEPTASIRANGLRGGATVGRRAHRAAAVSRGSDWSTAELAATAIALLLLALGVVVIKTARARPTSWADLA